MEAGDGEDVAKAHFAKFHGEEPLVDIAGGNGGEKMRGSGIGDGFMKIAAHCFFTLKAEVD